MGEDAKNTPAKDPEKFTKADKQKLKRHIDTIDALKLQQAELAAEIKEAMTEAELDGFSKKRINDVLRKRKLRRKQTKTETERAQLEFDLYWAASGADKFADALEEDAFDVDEDEPGRGGGRGLN